jgi:hypothetical protein
MSRDAYNARLKNLVRVRRSRAYDQTRRLEVDIALASHEGDTFRAIAIRGNVRQ